MVAVGKGGANRTFAMRQEADLVEADVIRRHDPARAAAAARLRRAQDASMTLDYERASVALGTLLNSAVSGGMLAREDRALILSMWPVKHPRVQA